MWEIVAKEPHVRLANQEAGFRFKGVDVFRKLEVGASDQVWAQGIQQRSYLLPKFLSYRLVLRMLNGQGESVL